MPLTGSDICKFICAVILPPLGVFLEVGCGADLLINIVLTIFGYIPGIIHAIYIIVTRPFSVMMSLRTAARSFEAHPFQRLSLTQKPAKADWNGDFKRVGKQAVLFFPGIAMLLGWPLAAARVLDGHV
ncbi:hypothetical protein O9K51_06072 [Purpureocillium lavendulum]|uniref:Plasma membrane proteolipid 3 n=1 Tax=Purpureocillium lavendulum TaxID=1247861 RepID=A0AB34FPH8_9HYPO|nr:hypothetical protein O9K51_06072 [Purpureocillium lavendulum]